MENIEVFADVFDSLHGTVQWNGALARRLARNANRLQSLCSLGNLRTVTASRRWKDHQSLPKGPGVKIPRASQPGEHLAISGLDNRRAGQIPNDCGGTAKANPHIIYPAADAVPPPFPARAGNEKISAKTTRTLDVSTCRYTVRDAAAKMPRAARAADLTTWINKCL